MQVLWSEVLVGSCVIFTIHCNLILNILDLYSFSVICCYCGKNKYTLLFPQEQLRHFPASALSQQLPPTIPSVDVTRSQGYDKGMLAFQRPYDHPFLMTQRDMFSVN